MIDSSRLLENLPPSLRDALVEEFNGIASACAEGRWKLAGIDGGRFCEVVYTILDGALLGKFPTKPQKPAKFPEACKALESRPPITVGDRSIRVLIPRILPGIYDIRNNRNIGHVGGDVSSNKMDSTYVKNAASWIFAELVRVFHGCSLEDAQASVDALVEYSHPLVWEIGNVRRVLDIRMSTPDRTLVLLHSVSGWCAIKELSSWAKGDKKFRTSVLERLSQRLLIEIDKNKDSVIITPLGIRHVEKKLT